MEMVSTSWCLPIEYWVKYETVPEHNTVWKLQLVHNMAVKILIYTVKTLKVPVE